MPPAAAPGDDEDGSLGPVQPRPMRPYGGPVVYEGLSPQCRSLSVAYGAELELRPHERLVNLRGSWT